MVITAPCGDEPATAAVKSAAAALIRVVSEISSIPEFRGPFRRLCCDLARRAKLLGPLFDEIHDGAAGDDGAGVEIGALSAVLGALTAARDLLRSVNQESKLYQALQSERYAKKFQEATELIDDALDGIPYDKIDVSEEVREQIELVHAQFKRARERAESLEAQFMEDLSAARTEKSCEPGVLKRLSEKLQLKTMNDLKQESLALHEMVIANGGDPEDCLEDMSSLLRKLRDCVPAESTLSSSETPAAESKESSPSYRSPIIPDDFRCPISLELMRDPVIVSTGQTYERACIRKWLDSGHKTCPKTQQTLSHTALTPNFVLKSLIGQWCEANGVEPPKKGGSSRDRRPGGRGDCDRSAIRLLLDRLIGGNEDEQRAAAGEIRLLAKRNGDNRVCIAEAGAIPLLVGLLSSQDRRTQEHVVTALLNLSINDGNKASIVNCGAIPEIVEVLKIGSMEARENAAATLFSLSVIDGNKVKIGEADAIPALIDLLREGSPRGKKDAATAIFNLAIFQGNKVRAVQAGIVLHLMRLLVDPSGGMVDEALAILAILASNPEGRAAIVASDPVAVLVEIMKAGSSRNRENAAAVLWSLCTADARQVVAARELGAEEALKELAEGGTDRAKRKAASLLELIRKDEDA